MDRNLLGALIPMNAPFPPWFKLHRVGIGGVNVVVEFDPSMNDFGQWDSDDQSIRMGPKAEGQFWETLRHEMMHASLSIGGVSYSEGMEEEAIVRNLENIFFPAWEAIKP